MANLDASLISAVAALITSAASLVWAFRRDGGRKRR